jgi:hypothetical protein
MSRASILSPDQIVQQSLSLRQGRIAPPVEPAVVAADQDSKKCCIADALVLYIRMAWGENQTIPSGRGTPDEPVERT